MYFIAGYNDTAVFSYEYKNKVTHAKKENKPKILRDGDIYDKSRTIVKNLKD